VTAQGTGILLLPALTINRATAERGLDILETCI
jgi:4-aminobutyrate aminotransferase-like enzyme